MISLEEKLNDALPLLISKTKSNQMKWEKIFARSSGVIYNFQFETLQLILTQTTLTLSNDFMTLVKLESSFSHNLYSRVPDLYDAVSQKDEDVQKLFSSLFEYIEKL